MFPGMRTQEFQPLARLFVAPGNVGPRTIDVNVPCSIRDSARALKISRTHERGQCSCLFLNGSPTLVASAVCFAAAAASAILDRAKSMRVGALQDSPVLRKLAPWINAAFTDPPKVCFDGRIHYLFV
jgi:hypothetical protein